MPYRKSKRTYDERGHAHYLTFSCQDKLPLLNRDRTRRWVIESVDAARRRHGYALWAWVIMPEHMHLLVWPQRRDYSISNFLFACKRPVSGKARNWLEKHGANEWIGRLTVRRGGRKTFRFWLPGGGYDHNVIEPEAVRGIIEYIHGNPVRRKLVDRVEDWPWSSAQFYAGVEDVPLVMDPIPF